MLQSLDIYVCHSLLSLKDKALAVYHYGDVTSVPHLLALGKLSKSILTDFSGASAAV
jgi:hypothetical protein